MQMFHTVGKHLDLPYACHQWSSVRKLSLALSEKKFPLRVYFLILVVLDLTL